MHVTSLCPFCVSTLLWEAQPSQFSLTVTVKATFSLVPGAEAEVADAQEPLGVDRHWDDRPMASLYAPADSAPSKRKVDVLLVGHAYAPAGTPAVSLVARFVVGDAFDKSVRVTGDRTWEAGEGGVFKPSAVAPFSRLPLRYERAPLSAENPVGIDASAPPLLGAPARPNLEPFDDAAMGAFGPVASTWRARRTRVDDAGLFWAYGVASEAPARTGPPPSNFDFSFFNAAPAEQQIELLRPGMTIELHNMSPSHPTLVSAVPVMRPQVFRVAKGGSRAEEITLRCDTLWIDTDRSLIVLTFRGVADAGGGSEDELGSLVVVADPGGKRLRWDRVQKLLETELRADTAPDPPPTGADERDPLAVRYDAVLDEATKGKVPDVLPEPPRIASEPPRRPRNPRQKTADQEIGARDAPAAPRTSRDAKTTPPPPMRAASRPPPVAPPPPPMPRDAAVDDEDSGPDKTQPIQLGARPLSPDFVATNPRARFVDDQATNPRARFVDDETTSERSQHDVRGLSQSDVALVMAAAREGEAVDDVDEPTRAKRLGRRQITTPGGHVAPIEPAEVGLFAAVSAHLARKGGERSAVLEAHGMTEAEFAALAERWRASLEAETERGKRELASAFDVAYVAAQERLDPPIGIAEYAQIVVALERGNVGKVLGELDLELSDLMRLQRVWSRRVAASPEVNNSLNAAIDAMRRE